MNTIPLLVPQMPTAARILPFLQEIDANRMYTNYGPLNARFEARIAAELGAGLSPANVSTVSNCTVGLELALQALSLKPGARVLLPAITFVATATAVLRAGLQPVLADVDADTWVLTPAHAESLLQSQRIDAVLTVATFGFAHGPAGWDALVQRHGVPVLIDAAGAFGNQAVGQHADVVFSFHATKSFGIGEGGAVVSRTPERIARIRKLANFGIDTRIAQLDEPGTNGKLSEYHAAVGLAAFEQWAEVQERRRFLHARYMERLREVSPRLGFQRKAPDGVYPLLPVLLPAGRSAAETAARLASQGIQTRRWYCPDLSLHPALRDCAKADPLSVATDIGARILGLPFFLDLSDAQIDHVCRCIGEL